MAELKLSVRLDAIPGAGPSASSLRRSLAMAARLGANSVELCGRTLVPVSDLSDTGIRTLRKILDDLNLSIASIRFPTRHGYDHLENLDRRVEATKQAMHTAYRLGAPLVVNQIGNVPTPPQNKSKHSPGMPSAANPASAANPSSIGQSIGQADVLQAFESLQAGGGMDPATAAQHIQEQMGGDVDPKWEILRGVLDDLGRYGSKVGAFFAAETGTEPAAHLAELIDTSAEAYIAVALNPGQLIINRHSVTESIRVLADRIKIVNAVDGVLDFAAGRGLTVAVGQGTADFPSMIGMLEDIPYRGPFVVGRPEMNDETALQELGQSLQYLKNL